MPTFLFFSYELSLSNCLIAISALIPCTIIIYKWIDGYDDELLPTIIFSVCAIGLLWLGAFGWMKFIGGPSGKYEIRILGSNYELNFLSQRKCWIKGIFDKDPKKGTWSRWGYTIKVYDESGTLIEELIYDSSYDTLTDVKKETREYMKTTP